MSYLTSSSPGIGDTVSRNAAYISGLVMMDVMMSCWQGRLLRCRRWDRLFYPSSLLLGDSRRADWLVTTLLPFPSLFYLLCISCLFVTRGLHDLCVLVVELCAERLVAKTFLLFGNFHIFRCFCLDISSAERLVAKTSLLFGNFHPFFFFSWYSVKSWSVRRCCGCCQFFFYFPV